MFAVFVSMCLLIAQVVILTPASAADIHNLTVGTEKTGDINADGDVEQNNSGSTNSSLTFLASVEKGKTYKVEVSATLTMAEDVQIMYLESHANAVKKVDNHYENIGKCYGNQSRGESVKTLSVSYFFISDTTGSAQIKVGIYADVNTFSNTSMSGNYSIKISESEDISKVLLPEWEVQTYADYGSVAVAKDGTAYVAAYYCEAEEYGTSSAPISSATASNTDSDNETLDDNYYLMAINPDGKIKWKFKMATYSDATALVGEDGTIYVGTYSTSFDKRNEEALTEEKAFFYAVTPEGKLKWERSFASEDDDDNDYDFWFSSAFTDGKLIVKTDSELLALNPETGKTIWQVAGLMDLNNRQNCNPVIAGGNVYVAAWSYEDDDTSLSDKENLLLAFDLETGNFKFGMELDDCCGPNECSMAADENGILYLLCDGLLEDEQDELQCPLYAIKPDGTVKWVVATDLRDTDKFPVLISEGVVYTAGQDDDGKNVLLTFNAENGSLLKKTEIPELTGTASNIALAENGDIYIADYGFSIVGLKADGSTVYAALVPYWDYDDPTEMVITRQGKLLTVAADGTLLSFDIQAGYASGWSMSFANPARQNAYTGNYKVTFETNGGSAVEDQWLDLNSLVTKPADPTKGTDTFLGWYTDKELTQLYDFESKVTKSMTLYAGWKTEEITEVIDESSSSTVSKAPVESNQKTGVGGAMGLVILTLIGGCAAALVCVKKKEA